MGEAAKHLLFECFHADCHVVLHGRRGTLCRLYIFGSVAKVSNFEYIGLLVQCGTLCRLYIFGSVAKVSNFEYIGLLVQ